MEKLYSMIGCSILRKIVSPYLFRPISRPYHYPSIFLLSQILLFLFRHLAILIGVKIRLSLYFYVATFRLGTLAYSVGRCQPYSRICFVNVLASCPEALNVSTLKSFLSIFISDNESCSARTATKHADV